MYDARALTRLYVKKSLLEDIVSYFDEVGIRCLPLEDDHGPYILGPEPEVIPGLLRFKNALVNSQVGDNFSFESSLYLSPQKSHYLYRTFLDCMRSNMPGDVAECGAMYCETASEMARCIERLENGKTVHIFDSFEGFPDKFTDDEVALNSEDDPDWNSRTPGAMEAPIELCHVSLNGRHAYQIHQGFFSETFADFDTPLCFIHADADLYYSTVEIIQMADRCLVTNGLIVVDDYGDPHFPGVEQAIAEALAGGRYVLEGTSPHYQALLRCVA